MLKMKELIELTNESKSTILFYLKEGLLPSPQKPKPNVHLYSDDSVNIIKFIKYLQGLNYTISEIKEIFKEVNLTKEASFLAMAKALEVATITKGAKLLKEDEFIKEANISKEELDIFLQKGYILKREKGFGVNEVEIAKIVKNAIDLGLQESLLDRYVKSARKIAKKENDAWQKVFSDASQDTIKEYEVLFDLMLKFKPYIYNAHSIKEYYQAKGER